MNPRKTKRETEVKALVLQELFKRGRISVGTVIADEYPLIGTGVRADLAFLQRRRIVGVEIKTEADSLRRLTKQMLVYEKYFDHTLLVVASKHFSSISANDFPEAEIWALSCSDKLTTVSRGKRSSERPRPPLLDLLTEKEKKQLSHLPAGPRTKFLSAFNSRYRDTSALFWSEADNITPHYLHLLSRFKPLRLQQSRQAQESKNKLQSWGNFK